MSRLFCLAFQCTPSLLNGIPVLLLLGLLLFLVLFCCCCCCCCYQVVTCYFTLLSIYTGRVSPLHSNVLLIVGIVNPHQVYLAPWHVAGIVLIHLLPKLMQLLRSEGSCWLLLQISYSKHKGSCFPANELDASCPLGLMGGQLNRSIRGQEACAIISAYMYSESSCRPYMYRVEAIYVWLQNHWRIRRCQKDVQRSI
jgi:hypothetical protein